MTTKANSLKKRAVEALHLRTHNVRAIKGAMSKESKARDDVLEECDRSFYEIQRGAARKIYLFLKANRSHVVF